MGSSSKLMFGLDKLTYTVQKCEIFSKCQSHFFERKQTYNVANNFFLPTHLGFNHAKTFICQEIKTTQKAFVTTTDGIIVHLKHCVGCRQNLLWKNKINFKNSKKLILFIFDQTHIADTFSFFENLSGFKIFSTLLFFDISLTFQYKGS